jgi:hypothetical protein
LATPASVDQDFNFITSVERSLQSADNLILDKGIDLAPSGIKRRFGKNGHDPKRKFETEVEARGIRLIKAPRGLSRSKQNKSHWAGQHKSIMWTTEWICYDGRQRIHNVIESRTVGETFANIFGRNPFHKKRKRSSAGTMTLPAIQGDAPEKSPEGLTDAEGNDGQQDTSLDKACASV